MRTCILSLISDSGGTILQKRSHKLLARSLMNSYDGFGKKSFEAAFLFGSFQPDCNPLSYLKGTFRARRFRGHNYSNFRPYIDSHIHRLQQRDHWTVWQYYTLGKLTHYLADAFTFPHNETYPDSIAAHRRYEDALRLSFSRFMAAETLRRETARADLAGALEQLHRQYVSQTSDSGRDSRFILLANELLMASVLPLPAGA